jgi:magnesium transporter
MNRAVELSIAFLEAQPAGAARVLDHIPAGEAAAFATAAPDEAVAGALGFMQPARAAALLERCPARKAGALLSRTAAHTRVLLLRILPETTRDAALATLPRREAAAMRRYLAYSPGSVGAWMEAPKATFAPDTTVGECVARLRQLGHRLGPTLFVVGSGRRLLGALDVDSLLGAADGALLEDVMRRDLVPLAPQASLASTLPLPAWDTALTLPVADRARRLVGVLHFESLREGLAVDRGEAAGLAFNMVLMHLTHALFVSVLGLLQVAATAPAPARIGNTPRSARAEEA